MSEVYEEDGDLFGDGINLAARIKSLASSSEILTTQAVYNSIRSEKNMHIKDIGRVVLKNIQDPERIFKVYNTKVQFDSEPLDALINHMKDRGVKKRLARHERHKSSWKKALVTLKAGETIEFFEGA